MDTLLKKALTIVLNEGGGAVSVLLIANIYFIWRLLKRFSVIEKSVSGLNGLIRKEIADMELIMIKKYVTWEAFDKVRDKVDKLASDIAKILGRLNGAK